MKSIIKRILISFLVFIITSFTIYSLLIISNFINWANDYELNPYTQEQDVTKIDSEKIKEIGKNVKQLENTINQSKYEREESIAQDVVADYFEPLGYSVWSYMEMEIQKIFSTSFITISVLMGIGLSIAYITITSKKVNIIIKIFIGYFGVILIVPHIYMYSYTYRLWDFITPYKAIPIYFYIGYTLIFVIMFIANYFVGLNMTKKLNQSINVK